MSVPYYPLYPTDFEADTSHLSLAEDGAYNRLLRLMWMTAGCSIPDDDLWIRRRMRCTQEEFETVVLPVISEFLVRKSGRVFSVRLVKEFKKADETYRARSEAGKKGGRPQAIENKENYVKAGFDFDKGNLKQPEPEPEPEPIKKKETRVAALVVPVESQLLEAGVSQETLDAWKVVRRAKKAGPVTALVVKGIKREAASAQISLDAALVMCCERGWQSFKAEWVQSGRGAGPPRRRTVSDALAESARTNGQSTMDNVRQLFGMNDGQSNQTSDFGDVGGLPVIEHLP